MSFISEKSQTILMKLLEDKRAISRFRSKNQEKYYLKNFRKNHAN